MEQKMTDSFDDIQFEVDRAERKIRDSHDGDMCFCGTCRGMLASAFVRDVGVASGEPLFKQLETFAVATIMAFQSIGLTREDAIRQLVRIGWPELDHSKVQIAVMKSSKEEVELATMTIKGSA